MFSKFFQVQLNFIIKGDNYDNKKLHKKGKNNRKKNKKEMKIVENR